MTHVLELMLAEVDGGMVLRSPEVGWFTLVLPRGTVVGAGEKAGVLVRLGASFELRVPAGARGTVASDRPALVREPVGFGDVLYRLVPSAASGADASTAQPAAAEHARASLVLRAPQSGRFYHRPAPGEPPFVSVGAVVVDGQPVGMIEVMKTFSHVTWRASGATRARVTALAVPDGGDVRAGDVLLELEPAPGA